MLNITLTDHYITAHELLLEEESYNEEVVVEASIEPFHLTCSIGNDCNGTYVTWNLRYYDAFIEHKTITIHNVALNVFDHEELLVETKYKFRQLLFKAANRSGSIAQCAQEQLAQL